MRFENVGEDKVCAYEDLWSGEPLASAVYKVNEEDESRATVTDIYQSSEYSFVGNQLLSYMENDLAQRGIEYLELDYVSGLPQRAVLKNLADMRGYRLKSDMWHILGFSYDKIKNSRKLMAYRADKSAECSYLVHSQVVTYCDRGNLPKHVCRVALEEANLKYSRFCVDDGKVEACVLVGDVTEDYLCITDMYLRPGYKKPMVILRLIAAVLLDDRFINRPPKYVFINCTSDKFLRLCNGLFKEPDMDRVLGTYQKRIKPY